MPRHWFQYGRPRGTPNTSSPEVKAYDSCLDLDLASLEWKDGHINCGFVDDTLWYKADGSDKGSAVVKLSFNLKHKVKKKSEQSRMPRNLLPGTQRTVPRCASMLAVRAARKPQHRASQQRTRLDSSRGGDGLWWIPRRNASQQRKNRPEQLGAHLAA